MVEQDNVEAQPRRVRMMTKDLDDLDDSKTLKVSIPTAHHLRLHALKILEGRTISATVEEALDQYFEGSGLEDIDLDTGSSNLLGLGGRTKASEDGS